MLVGLGHRYLINPQRRYHRDTEQCLRVSVPYCRKSLQGTTALATLLDQLASEPPQPGHDLVSRLTPPVFELLVKHFVLLPETYADALRAGLCSPPSSPAGTPLAAHDLDRIAPDDVVLCHAPLVAAPHGAVSVAGGGRWIRANLASSLRHPLGERGQPGWLMDLDFGTRLEAARLRLFDAGDVCYDPMLDNASLLGQRTGFLCRQIVARGGRLLLLGGDHTLAHYSIGALAERYPRLGVLQFDAHPDLYTVGADCDLTLNHANVFHWVRKMPHVDTIWQIGIRDMYHQPLARLSAGHDAKLQALSAMEIALKGYGRLLCELDDTIPWFISFDVDVLDRIDLPSTATPVLGGLSYYPLLQMFEQLFAHLNIVGMEFVELGDNNQSAHGPAAIAARLCSRYLFCLRGASPLTENVFTSTGS